ncbi:hypothetical protein B0H14DRAFT_3126956 [Mycena olivaceomarginata]|nr:hypothetical protein B0H14DRAFT_3126956 [Mycena olivaceomarginata]
MQTPPTSSRREFGRRKLPHLSKGRKCGAGRNCDTGNCKSCTSREFTSEVSLRCSTHSKVVLSSESSRPGSPTVFDSILDAEKRLTAVADQGLAAVVSYEIARYVGYRCSCDGVLFERGGPGAERRKLRCGLNSNGNAMRFRVEYASWKEGRRASDWTTATRIRIIGGVKVRSWPVGGGPRHETKRVGLCSRSRAGNIVHPFTMIETIQVFVLSSTNRKLQCTCKNGHSDKRRERQRGRGGWERMAAEVGVKLVFGRGQGRRDEWFVLVFVRGQRLYRIQTNRSSYAGRKGCTHHDLVVTSLAVPPSK